MQWVLGPPHNAVDWDAHKAYRVRIEAAGPFGLIEPLEYVISIESHTAARPTIDQAGLSRPVSGPPGAGSGAVDGARSSCSASSR
jgi:hypothetical protein